MSERELPAHTIDRIQGLDTGQMDEYETLNHWAIALFLIPQRIGGQHTNVAVTRVDRMVQTRPSEIEFNDIIFIFPAIQAVFSK